MTADEYRRFVEATERDHSGGIYVWSGSEWKMDASKSWRDPGFKQTDRHPVVGVSWLLRSAVRVGVGPVIRNVHLGFRVARTLN